MGQYRCENGGCAYNKDTCIEDLDYVCKGDEKNVLMDCVIKIVMKYFSIDVKLY